MVLGWGKKTVTKHEEEEDMTMDEILASIRRYVTEDQSPQRETPLAKQQSGVPKESTRFEPSPPLQSNFESAPSASKMTNYDEPYNTNEMLEDQVAMSETPLSSYAPQQPYFGGMPEEPREKESSSYPPERRAQHTTPHHSLPENHAYHQSSEPGITAESAISASAMALSRLAEIQNEQHALESIGALTLDTLIANLARPMIKEWLDKNLFPIVEGMVEKEIERIRNHLTK